MPETCTATTAKGTRCKRVPIAEGQCSIHSGKQRVGPKGKLTRDIIDAFVDLQSDGVLLKHAAEALGVHHSTVARWREVGEADIEQGRVDTLHAQFTQESSRARAEGIIFHVKNLKAHAPKDHRASVFFLERTDPDSYSRRDKTELTHSGQVANPVVPSDPAHNAEVLRILKETGGLDGLLAELETQGEMQGDDKPA